MFEYQYLPSPVSPASSEDFSAPSTTTTSSPRQRQSVPVLRSEEAIWLSEQRSDHSPVPRGSSVGASAVLSPPQHSWPLEDEHEARLIQYFVTVLASWVSGPNTKSIRVVPLLIAVPSSLTTATPLTRSLQRLHSLLLHRPLCGTPYLQLQLGTLASKAAMDRTLQINIIESVWSC